MKVLIVDDSMASRHILRTVFEAEGDDVIEAVDGAQALDILWKNRKDDARIELVILDWTMPVLTGLQCLEKIRALPDHKSIPIVMCTARSENASIMTAMRAGANGSVLKPVTRSTVRKQARQAVEAFAA